MCVIRISYAGDLQVQQYCILFYSQDHEPVHVHVRQAGRSVVIVIETLEVKNNKGFRPNEIRLLQEKVKEHKELIKEMWHEHFEEKED